jgi:RsmE family RNA methyltransferase
VNLILLDAADLDAAGVARLGDARALHVARVLNATVGQQVRVGLVDGPLGIGTVESVEADAVAMRCAFDATPPPRPRVDLLLALPRPKVMRRLWSQLAALGVGQIILTNAARVERHYFDTHILEPSTYIPLLKEGLQQARDTWVPRVEVHRRLKVLVQDHLDTLFPAGPRLLAEPGEGPPLREALGPARATATEGAGGPRTLLAMGPEGGWTEFELSLLAAHGFTTVSLGARTLRSDTAAVALLALAHDALRDPDAAG